jgi:molybdenum cofactor cytidylyltransferase
VKFGPVPVADAEGAILAHGISIEGKRYKKGQRLEGADLAALAEAGIHKVIVARLEPGDVDENTAAQSVAQVAAGSGTATSPPFTGRCNINATARGVLVSARERVDAINLLDEALTVATMPPFAVVEEGQLVATVKVIPFSAPEIAVAEACGRAVEPEPLVRVAPFAAHRAGLILTRLPGVKESVLDKTAESVERRLAVMGSRLMRSNRCAHEEAAIEAVLRDYVAAELSPILIFGASAIVDRRDVVPAAVTAAGGQIVHFGLPVDPGNLLLLARLGEADVLGLPGSARSLRHNAFDLILSRLLADLPVTGPELMQLGAGGLLKEMPDRPEPRERSRGRGKAKPRVAALVLAAGSSRRMGPDNKLLADVGGKAMVAGVVDAVLDSSARPIVVVTGHDEAAVREVLRDRPVTFVHNERHLEGLSTSLHAGLDALPPEVDGALVCLGDMPRLAARHVDALIAAFDPAQGRGICVPTRGGKRGNPVLWGRAYFNEMRTVAGDVGARHLIGEFGDDVFEVEMSDDGIFIDIDTPDALARFRDA